MRPVKLLRSAAALPRIAPTPVRIVCVCVIEMMTTVLVAVLVCVSVVVASGDGGWGPEPGQRSGYITVNTLKDNGGHVFYWLFQSRSSDPSKDPLVIWMTGGPGCSSELAVFYEQGPYRLDANGTVTINPHAWNNVANVLFVDQPVGTGFSYADHADDYVTDETQVGEDMYEFLQAFMIALPEYKERAVFVTGESYAGHYVPAVANRIWKGNQAKKALPINLSGVAIGNGLVNAERQYPEYITFAKQHNLFQTSNQERFVQAQTSLCVSMMKYNIPGKFIACNSIVSSVKSFGNNFNVYDVRKKCIGAMCYDFSQLDRLMADKDVQRSLGVSPKAAWSECDMEVYANLMGDWFTKCDIMLVPLLEAGIPVLVYSGKEDFICNYLGGLAWVQALPWSGADKYNKASFIDWKVDGQVAGSVKSAGPLTFLQIADAGHMVPMDQPEHSLAMLKTFLSGSSSYTDDTTPTSHHVRQIAVI